MTLAETDIPPFKSWILRRVKQVVESDHDILADYIIALLQHEGTIDQLRQICLKDLKDFLHAQTEPFVEELLSAYQSQSYLQEAQSNDQQVNESASANHPPNLSTASFPNNSNQFNNNFYNPGNIPGFGGSPDGSVPFNTGGFFSNNDNTNNGDDYGNDIYINSQKIFRNGFRNRRNNNNNGSRQNRNNNFQNMNFDSGNSDSYQNNYDIGDQGNSNYNNRNHHNNHNNNYHKAKRAQYLNSITSTQADDEFVKRRLVIEKIPEEKFNELDIRTYFGKFGEIITLNLDTNYQLAFIEYKTHLEALNAWQSPDPIFGNRFVKVYWQKNDINFSGNNGNSVNGTNSGEGNADTTKDKIDVEAVKVIQAQKQRVFEEKLARKKANQDKMLMITQEKLKILQLQKEQATKLLELAQKSGDDKEISTKQNTSNALEAQLEALKQEALRLGIYTQPTFPVVNHGRGGHSYRGGSSRGGSRASYYNTSSYSPYSRYNPSAGAGSYINTSKFNLDLRPRTITIKPVTPDKEETLRTYLISSVGDYQDFKRVDESSVNVTFADRKSAESFYYAPVNPDLGPMEKKWKATEPVSKSDNMELDK